MDISSTKMEGNYIAMVVGFYASLILTVFAKSTEEEQIYHEKTYP